VVFAGMKGKYGNLISLDHGEGITSHYAHLRRSRSKRAKPCRRESGSSGGGDRKVTDPIPLSRSAKGGNPRIPSLFGKNELSLFERVRKILGLETHLVG
jgi:hypothetical protein